MPEVLNIEDINQQYLNGISMYNGVPVFVLSVNDRKNVAIQYLDTGKRQSVPFSLETFSPPNLRLGMLNTEYGAVYVKRNPVRRMSVCIDRNNTQLSPLYLCEYMGNGWGHAQQAAHKMNTPEWGHMISGDYPDFRTCIEFVKDFDTAVAFDRQFAIDSKFNILYKDVDGIVGKLPKNCRTIDRIQFDKKWEYLNFLLGDNCVQALRLVA